jgi:hypothetical protein
MTWPEFVKDILRSPKDQDRDLRPAGKKPKPRCRARFVLLQEVGVVPLPVDITSMKEYTVTTPVPPGKGYALRIATDEAVDAQPDGSFAVSSVISGDSLAPNIMPTSTNKLLDVVLRGDGAVGLKEVEVRVDAHVGTGDVPLALRVKYTVDSKDATDFAQVTETGVVDLPPAPTA